MTSSSLIAQSSFLLVVFFIPILSSTSLRVMLPQPPCEDEGSGRSVVKGSSGMELYPTGSGSSLPDCSHACGPCSPCKRVMVSFSKCSTSESCPVVYRCICKGKFYHVPGF